MSFIPAKFLGDPFNQFTRKTILISNKFPNDIFSLSHKKVHLCTKHFQILYFYKKLNCTNSTKCILFFVLVSPLLMVRPLCPNLSTPLSTCRPTSLLIDSKCNWVLLVVRSRGCFSRLLQKLQTWNTWVPSWLGWWSWLQEFSFRFRSSEVNDFFKENYVS